MRFRRALGLVCLGLFWEGKLGLICCGLGKLGLVCFGLGKLGLVCLLDSDRLGLVSTLWFLSFTAFRNEVNSVHFCFVALYCHPGLNIDALCFRGFDPCALLFLAYVLWQFVFALNRTVQFSPI